VAPGQIVKINEIPFIAASEVSRGGFIPSSIFYVEEQWRCWAPIDEPGKFVEI
jgi:hypothetical protein